jgi:hypothetical protein
VNTIRRHFEWFFTYNRTCHQQSLLEVSWSYTVEYNKNFVDLVGGRCGITSGVFGLTFLNRRTVPKHISIYPVNGERCNMWKNIFISLWYSLAQCIEQQDRSLNCKIDSLSRYRIFRCMCQICTQCGNNMKLVSYFGVFLK